MFRNYIFDWCIKRIWQKMTYNGWCAIKPNQNKPKYSRRMGVLTSYEVHSLSQDTLFGGGRSRLQGNQSGKGRPGSIPGWILASRLWLQNILTAPLHLYRGVRSPNKYPGYDTKQSDSKVAVMLELWRMQSTPSLPSLRYSLCPGVVAHDRALSLG